MEFKAGQIFKSEKQGSIITVFEVVKSNALSKVTFKIEVPKDKWESCTTWFSDVLTEFINTHEFVLIA